MCNNGDILSEILSYLPVKSLWRFKTVVKSWQDIIGSWAFVKLHQENYCNNCSNDKGILVQVYDGTTYKWKLLTKYIDCSKLCRQSMLDADFMEPIRRNEIPFYQRMVGPIDCLICIHRIDRNTVIALCNPSLARTLFLPISPISWNRNSDAYQRYVGFGFDIHKDLKVVQLFILDYDGKPRVEIYSQSTNTWKELDHEIHNDMHVKNSIMPYKNGSSSFSHWLAFKQLRQTDGANYSLLSFNMQNEVFERTSVPHCVHDAEYERQVKLRFLAG
ncbi:hypothetical protein Sango_0720400 [Sesamum angolense]|uniref:F-box domain-containing protein n=1 Tax=Sesamum angolense TaxID=2727404 RepID=A0AAE2BZI3_9LAMI|nr:hypothetical protein Sango_0720400 [Sesamum angolense]